MFKLKESITQFTVNYLECWKEYIITNQDKDNFTGKYYKTKDRREKCMQSFKFNMHDKIGNCSMFLTPFPMLKLEKTKQLNHETPQF